MDGNELWAGQGREGDKEMGVSPVRGLHVSQKVNHVLCIPNISTRLVRRRQRCEHVSGGRGRTLRLIPHHDLCTHSCIAN